MLTKRQIDQIMIYKSGFLWVFYILKLGVLSIQDFPFRIKILQIKTLPQYRNKLQHLPYWSRLHQILDSPFSLYLINIGVRFHN